MRDPAIVAIVLIARACSGSDDPPPVSVAGAGGSGGGSSSVTTTTATTATTSVTTGAGGSTPTTTTTSGVGGMGGAGGQGGAASCLDCAAALEGWNPDQLGICPGAQSYLDAITQAACSVEVCMGVCNCGAVDLNMSCKTCLKGNSDVIQACEAH